MNKNLIYMLCGAVAIAVIFYFLGASGIKFAGADVVNPMNPVFTNGFRVGVGMTQIIDKDGVVTLAGTSTFSNFILGSGGTAQANYKCYSAAYNPAAITSSTVADSVAFLTPGAVVGDIIRASLDTATSTDSWTVDAKVTAGSGTATATTTLYMKGWASINLTTTTAKVCITH